MSKSFARYDILINSDNDQLNIDLILNSTDKKIIHGTVWDDNLLSPKRVPGALVQLYMAGENYKDDPLDIIPIGHVTSDTSGEFLAGPFDKGTSVILKIFKIWSYSEYNDNNNYKASYISCSGETSGECSGETSGECSGETSGECSGEASGEYSGEASGEYSGEASGEKIIDNKDIYKMEDCNCDKSSCDLCTTIIADPTDALEHGTRLVTVKIKICNVCFEKKVAVAVNIYDKCDKILAFRGFTKKLRRPNQCDKNACGIIERKLVFILPADDEFDNSKLKVVTKANYIYPCKPSKCED